MQCRGSLKPKTAKNDPQALNIARTAIVLHIVGVQVRWMMAVVRIALGSQAQAKLHSARPKFDLPPEGPSTQILRY